MISIITFKRGTLKDYEHDSSQSALRDSSLYQSMSIRLHALLILIASNC